MFLCIDGFLREERRLRSDASHALAFCTVGPMLLCFPRCPCRRADFSLKLALSHFGGKRSSVFVWFPEGVLSLYTNDEEACQPPQQFPAAQRCDEPALGVPRRARSCSLHRDPKCAIPCTARELCRDAFFFLDQATDAFALLVALSFRSRGETRARARVRSLPESLAVNRAAALRVAPT